jgi:hypothetical protein
MFSRLTTVPGNDLIQDLLRLKVEAQIIRENTFDCVACTFEGWEAIRQHFTEIKKSPLNADMIYGLPVYCFHTIREALAFRDREKRNGVNVLAVVRDAELAGLPDGTYRTIPERSHVQTDDRRTVGGV